MVKIRGMSISGNFLMGVNRFGHGLTRRYTLSRLPRDRTCPGPPALGPRTQPSRNRRSVGRQSCSRHLGSKFTDAFRVFSPDVLRSPKLDHTAKGVSGRLTEQTASDAGGGSRLRARALAAQARLLGPGKRLVVLAKPFSGSLSGR